MKLNGSTVFSQLPPVFFILLQNNMLQRENDELKRRIAGKSD